MMCQNHPCPNTPPDGWSYCSTECIFRGVADKDLQTARVDYPNHFTPEELAEKLGISKATVYQWTHSGKIPCIRISRKRAVYNLEEVKAALSNHPVIVRYKFQDDPVEAGNGNNTPSVKIPELGEIRDQMLKAAKEAARDVVLAAADRAKDLSDHALRAQLLEDFIHLEEGLRMAFEPRK